MQNDGPSSSTPRHVAYFPPRPKFHRENPEIAQKRSLMDVEPIFDPRPNDPDDEFGSRPKKVKKEKPEFYDCPEPECGRRYTLKSSLVSHMRLHSEIEPRKYVCHYCQRACSTPYRLKTHLRLHAPEKHFQCNFCPAGFNNKEPFENHLRTHEGQKIYKPRKPIDTRLVKPEGLENSNEKEMKTCPKRNCARQFPNESTLKTHLKWHDDERPFPCPHCPLKCRTEVHLRTHLRIHTGEKPFKCTFCTETFARGDGLKNHIMKHHDGKILFKKPLDPNQVSLLSPEMFKEKWTKKELICDCGKKFSSQSAFDTHQRIHNGERPFECTTCGKKFAQKHSLTAHERTHSGETPYHCDKCPEKFSRSDQLRAHLKKHVGEKTIVCGLCGEMFETNQEKTEHVLTSHLANKLQVSRAINLGLPVPDREPEVIRCAPPRPEPEPIEAPPVRYITLLPVNVPANAKLTLQMVGNGPLPVKVTKKLTMGGLEGSEKPPTFTFLPAENPEEAPGTSTSPKPLVNVIVKVVEGLGGLGGLESSERSERSDRSERSEGFGVSEGLERSEKPPTVTVFPVELPAELPETSTTPILETKSKKPKIKVGKRKKLESMKIRLAAAREARNLGKAEKLAEIPAENTVETALEVEEMEEPQQVKQRKEPKPPKIKIGKRKKKENDKIRLAAVREKKYERMQAARNQAQEEGLAEILDDIISDEIAAENPDEIPDEIDPEMEGMEEWDRNQAQEMEQLAEIPAETQTETDPEMKEMEPRNEPMEQREELLEHRNQPVEQMEEVVEHRNEPIQLEEPMEHRNSLMEPKNEPVKYRNEPRPDEPKEHRNEMMKDRSELIKQRNKPIEQPGALNLAEQLGEKIPPGESRVLMMSPEQMKVLKVAGVKTPVEPARKLYPIAPKFPVTLTKRPPSYVRLERLPPASIRQSRYLKVGSSPQKIRKLSPIGPKPPVMASQSPKKLQVPPTMLKQRLITQKPSAAVLQALRVSLNSSKVVKQHPITSKPPQSGPQTQKIAPRPTVTCTVRKVVPIAPKPSQPSVIKSSKFLSPSKMEKPATGQKSANCLPLLKIALFPGKPPRT